MAAILGISRHILSWYETGQIGYDAKGRKTLARLCKWLREEAGRQAEARLAEWLAGFEESSLCPEEDLRPYKYKADTSAKETE